MSQYYRDLTARLAQGPFVLVAPLSNELVRNWPLERYGELCEWFSREMGHVCLVVGSRAQRERLNSMPGLRRNDGVINSAGLLTFSETLSCMTRSQVVVGNNSGICHYSSYLGIKTVALYAAAFSLVKWSPGFGPITCLQVNIPCAGCAGQCPHDRQCMRDLTLSRVQEACVKNLAPVLR